jgi:phenylalanyl-tRNA synthetase beta chain
MKIPIYWLEEYVDINVTLKDYADAITLSGSKVEGIETLGEEIEKVIVGEIKTIEKHPDADKLIVSLVDIGKEKIQIVTGAKNVNIGDKIPVAIHGSTLPGGLKIKKGKLRGVESQGMMCSIIELGLTKGDYPKAAQDGIFILNNEYKPGEDVKALLGLDRAIIEFEITSNRPDCLSVVGIARETAVTLGTEFRMPIIEVKEIEEDVNNLATVDIKSPDLCPRYAARIIKNVKIESSPRWMREKLKGAGVRPINNIVDITNYVMLEIGQPMHAFDLDTLAGKQIIVRKAYKGEKMATLDDQERALDANMLVIADKERVIALAGVMGGANSEVSNNTKNILLESANFSGESIRVTAKTVGLRTEASARFEKGLDIENTITAINRAAQLIEEIGAGTVCKGIIDCYPSEKEIRKVRFSPEYINGFLGTSIKTEKMVEILERLEFKVNLKENYVIAPSFRIDIEIEADVAEEIARFYDYNNIKPTLLVGKATTQGKRTYEQIIEKNIHNIMTSCGLFEIYTYSFASPKVFDLLGLPKNDLRRNAVTISNPLGEDFSIMRTTTIPEMLNIISRNYNRRISEGGFYEIGRIYEPNEDSNKLPTESKMLTTGLYGEFDFYDMKGIVEELLYNLGIENVEFEKPKEVYELHPGRTAFVMINGENCGVIGQVHPDMKDSFEVPEKTFIGVLNIDKLIKYAKLLSKYKHLPKYPSLDRDLALIVNESVTVGSIEKVIQENGRGILEEVKLFDVYQGKQVGEGLKSLAYSLTFRSDEKTLKDEEVNEVVDAVIKKLETEFKAKLR